MCNALGNIFRMIILGATGLALAMQILTALSCDLVKSPNDGNTFGVFYISDGNGNCISENYTTDDPVIMGARSALILSTIAGFAAGVMVAFEWLFCEVCCAGCLEGLCYMAAWVIGGATFMFYGNEVCLALQDANSECEYSQASAYMTVACICYFGCSILLCFTPQPEPLCKQ